MFLQFFYYHLLLQTPKTADKVKVWRNSYIYSCKRHNYNKCIISPKEHLPVSLYDFLSSFFPSFLSDLKIYSQAFKEMNMFQVIK